jgi:hypothetical protein
MPSQRRKRDLPMNVARSVLRLLAVIVFYGPAIAAQAAESYDNCTGVITSLPVVISSQGTWCLKQSLGTSLTSGSAIEIATNNVTIDCNGFRVSGTGGGTGTAMIGIYAQNRVNATVRNCAVNGFYVGLSFTGASGGHLIAHNRFTNNTYIGVGVYNLATGKNASLLRDNQILYTGGSTINANGYGIFASQAVDVLDNTVSGVTARSGGGGTVYGIAEVDNDFANGANVSGNRVRDLKRDGAGLAYGIVTTIGSGSGSRHVVIRDNDLGKGGAGSIGIACYDNTSVIRDNVVHDFVNATSICADGGGNVQTP